MLVPLFCIVGPVMFCWINWDNPEPVFKPLHVPWFMHSKGKQNNSFLKENVYYYLSLYFFQFVWVVFLLLLLLPLLILKDIPLKAIWRALYFWFAGMAWTLECLLPRKSVSPCYSLHEYISNPEPFIMPRYRYNISLKIQDLKSRNWPNSHFLMVWNTIEFFFLWKWKIWGFRSFLPFFMKIISMAYHTMVYHTTVYHTMV